MSDRVNIDALRARLDGTRGRHYWRSLESLAETPEFTEFLHREFPQNASEWLDPAGRRNFLKLMGASLALAGVSAPIAPAAESSSPSRPDREAPPQRSRRHRGALVRFGGDVTVPADEIVADDVVVFGGNADVDGQVDGDVVVIGGKATLGPHADVRRDVTVVGGSLTRDPNALVRGRVEEVGVGDSHFGPPWFRRGFPFFAWWRPLEGRNAAATSGSETRAPGSARGVHCRGQLLPRPRAGDTHAPRACRERSAYESG